jgi:metal-responsive CopG/Arc/MetJ family transcriptional regulator
MKRISITISDENISKLDEMVELFQSNRSYTIGIALKRLYIAKDGIKELLENDASIDSEKSE